MSEGRNKRQLTFRFDLRAVCVLLVLVILVMLALWQPWQGSVGSGDRKITVSGQASVSAEPDEFQFSPLYERENVEQIAVLSGGLTAKLKELGVPEKNFTINASSYDKYPTDLRSGTVPGSAGTTNTLSISITVDSKELAQKVQDYLLTTSPKGSITPYPTFSETRNKELENEARGKAIEDARKRAEETAGELGAKIGAVIEVKEGGNFGMVPLRVDAAAPAADGITSSIPVTPGENEYNYTVEVVFALK